MAAWHPGHPGLFPRVCSHMPLHTHTYPAGLFPHVLRLAQVMEKLNGSWQLAYTCNSLLSSVLALGRCASGLTPHLHRPGVQCTAPTPPGVARRLPLVTVGDIVQRIDTTAKTVENEVSALGGV